MGDLIYIDAHARIKLVWLSLRVQGTHIVLFGMCFRDRMGNMNFRLLFLRNRPKRDMGDFKIESYTHMILSSLILVSTARTT